MSARNRGSKQKAIQKSNTCCGSSVVLFVISFIALGLLSISFLTIFHLKPLDYSLLRKPTVKTTTTLPTKIINAPIIEKKTVSESQITSLETTVPLSIKIVQKVETKSTVIQYTLPVHPYYDKTDKKRGFDVHFIHIPKCGGTSMTAILREVACKLDSSRNKDCCTNPGAYIYTYICLQICMYRHTSIYTIPIN
jgi:hypothetical protein